MLSVDHLLNASTAMVKAIHETFHQLQSRFCCCGGHFIGISGVAGQWFFAQNMFAGAQRVDGPVVVEVVGQWNIDHIDVRIIH